MELQTVKIDLPGGAHATLFKDVLRKTIRLHEAEMRQYMHPKPDSKVTVSQTELEANPQGNYALEYEVDLVAMEAGQAAINDIYLINQTKEWSFGPVDAATLDMVPAEQYKALVKAMEELYKPNPLAAGA